MYSLTVLDLILIPTVVSPLMMDDSNGLAGKEVVLCRVEWHPQIWVVTMVSEAEGKKVLLFF